MKTQQKTVHSLGTSLYYYLLCASTKFAMGLYLTVYINLYITCSQKGETRTALHSLPNVNPNLLCCLAYMHARKTGVHFLFLSTMLSVSILFSLVPRPPIFAFPLHPQ